MLKFITLQEVDSYIIGIKDKKGHCLQKSSCSNHKVVQFFFFGNTRSKLTTSLSQELETKTLSFILMALYSSFSPSSSLTSSPSRLFTPNVPHLPPLILPSPPLVFLLPPRMPFSLKCPDPQVFASSTAKHFEHVLPLARAMLRYSNKKCFSFLPIHLYCSV